jgi:glycerate 2-kinase
LSVRSGTSRTKGEKIRRDGRQILAAALRSADAGEAVRRHLRRRGKTLVAGREILGLEDFDRVFLVAVGKASAAMAAAVQEILGERLTGGIVVSKHGHITHPLPQLTVFEAGHPIPDEQGLAASRDIRALLADLNARDLLVLAISGGASALLVAPQEPVTLQDKQRTTDLLLRAGANITDLNVVRKHLSALKGGRMAALAYPATVVSLLLSDVIGDLPDVIGSGPAVPDSTTFADALAVLERFGIVKKVPVLVRKQLELGATGKVPETPKPGEEFFAHVRNVMVGSNSQALEAAAREARRLGYRPLILSSSIQGETRQVARVHAQILCEVLRSGRPIARPACILSGGETTVTVKGGGKGGRNQEFALAGAVEIAGLKDCLVLSAGTDGTDGPTDAAGAMADGRTVGRALQAGLDPTKYLERNDSYPFFERLNDLIKTGATGTNVMDIHMLLAGPTEERAKARAQRN